MKYRLTAMFIILAMLLTGCAPEISREDKSEKVYATFYPIYVLSSLVLDDIPGIRLKCLVQPQDDCLRLYDLSDWDASVLAYDADCIIIGGNGLESFENALYSADEDGAAVVEATYSLELYEYTGENTYDTTGHLTGINPHAYMSADLAGQIINTICNAARKLYPEHSNKISENTEDALKKISELKNRIDGIRNNTYGKNVILMNEALEYVAKDYGLNPVYRYDRESATTIYGEKLAEAINIFSDLDADAVMIEEQAPAELIEALEEAGFEVIRINIMASGYTNARDAYCNIQLENAARIESAFNK